MNNLQTIMTQDSAGQAVLVTLHVAPGVAVEHVPPESGPLPAPELPQLPTVRVTIVQQRIRLRWAYGSSLVSPRLPAGSVLVVDQHIAAQIDRDSPGVAEVIDPLVGERIEIMPRLPEQVAEICTWDEYTSYEPAGASVTPAIGL